ncbi:hypothetical protein [Fervidobacterium sp.]
MQWDKIMKAAELLSEEMLKAAEEYKKEERKKSFLGEAEKSLQYYIFKEYDETAMNRYLKEMANNPPPRSKQTQGYYKKIRHIWQQWSPKCGLTGIDKARAWGWGVRMAMSRLRLPQPQQHL